MRYDRKYQKWLDQQFEEFKKWLDTAPREDRQNFTKWLCRKSYNELADERAKCADLESRLISTGDRDLENVCRFHDEKERAADLEQQLTAERAKTALAQQKLMLIVEECSRNIGCNHPCDHGGDCDEDCSGCANIDDCVGCMIARMAT